MLEIAAADDDDDDLHSSGANATNNYLTTLNGSTQIALLHYNTYRHFYYTRNGRKKCFYKKMLMII